MRSLGVFVYFCLFFKDIDGTESGFTSCSINVFTRIFPFHLGCKTKPTDARKSVSSPISPLPLVSSADHSMLKFLIFEPCSSRQISGFLGPPINILKCAGEVHCMMDNETPNLNRQTNTLSLAPACFF